MKNRVYLRALNVDDYLKTHEWRSDPVYKRGVASQERYTNIETEKKWIESVIKKHESGKDVRLAIIESETDEFIGMIYLVDINYVNKTAAVGSLIGPNSFRGKGYIFEARLKLFDYAFNELGLNRISAHILEDNKRSIRAVEKFGYFKEGVLREAVFKNGEFKNLVSFSMLKTEFMDRYKEIITNK